MRRVSAAVVISMLFVAGGLALANAGATDVSGNITADTTWDLAGSPYVVTNTVRVNQGVTLTIEPGVAVWFNNGKGMVVDGTLKAIGTQAQNIFFTSSSPTPSPGIWDKIEITSKSTGSEFHWCDISYADCGVGSKSGPFKIFNSTIHDIYDEGIDCYNNVFDVVDCTITSCDEGFWFMDAYGNATRNTVEWCDTGAFLLSSFGQIDNNTFENYTGMGLFIDSGDDCVVKDNLITRSAGGTIGVYVGWESTTHLVNNTILNPTREPGSWGIWIDDCAPVVEYNYIADQEEGIYSDWDSMPTIRGNYIFNSSNNGLYMDTWKMPLVPAIIEDNVVDTAGQNGFWLERTWTSIDNNTFVNVPTGINCTEARLALENSTVESGETSIYLTADSHVNSLDTTFDKSTVKFGDAASDLTVRWTLDVKVVDASNVPVSGATVRVRDNANGTYDSTSLTLADGYARDYVVTEYFQDSASTTLYTPHYITASRLLESSHVNCTVERTKECWILLGDFSVPLASGWNLVSVPFVHEDDTIASVLSSIAGSYDFVEVYDASAGTWSDTSGGLTQLDTCYGFWVHMTVPATLNVASKHLSTGETFRLYAGLNLVSYPSLVADTVDNNLAGIPWTGVQTFSSGAWSDNAPARPTEFNDLDQMAPGQGYWVTVASDCEWCVCE